MSGTSGESTCPICGESMSTYSDWKPIDSVFGECLNCGFIYYTKREQMKLEEINEKRKEYNEDIGIDKDDEDYLKPLDKKDLTKWAKEIDKI